jgi:competence protein ComEC
VGPALGPLAPICLAMLGTGLALTRPLPGGLVTSRTLLGLILLASMTLLLAAVSRGPVAALLLVVAASLVMAAGVLIRLHTFDLGLIPRLVDRGGVATIEARVATEPRSGARGWQTVVRVHAVDGIATRERAVLFIDRAEPLGTPLLLSASARPLPDGGYGRWLTQHHASAVLDVRELDVTGSAGPLTRASEHVRGRIREAATRHLDDDVGGLLVGFVTGDTRLLPEADGEAMRATGLTHLTAVSGSNTAMLLAGVAVVLTFLGVGARGRWVLLAGTVLWFAFVTRLEPSVLRAGTMALLVIAAAVRGVARDPRHLLLGALLLLLSIDPLLSWSLGLLLSAGATLGVLVVAPLLTLRLEPVIPRRIAQLLGITLGAQLTVAPVLLAGFGSVELIAIPANMLAVPLAAFGASVAFVASTVAIVDVAAASGIFMVAAPAAAGVLAVARHGAAMSLAPTWTLGPREALVMLVVSVLGALGALARRSLSPQGASTASVKTSITRVSSAREAGLASRSATTAPSA